MKYQLRCILFYLLIINLLSPAKWGWYASNWEPEPNRYVPFCWGPDDRAVFKKAVDFIKQIHGGAESRKSMIRGQVIDRPTLFEPYWILEAGGEEILFSTGRLDSRYDQYLLFINLKARRSEFLPGQRTPVRLNGYHVDCMWFEHSRLEKVAVVFLQDILLKENEPNIIWFDSRADGGLELLDLAFRPVPPHIAHAGGSCRGLTYTNSVEALAGNCSAFRLFEIDFEWTKDKQLICLHDWGKTFTKLFGFEIDGPLELDSFLKLRTVSGITPLTLASLNEFLRDNPSVKIITDIKTKNIQGLHELAKRFPDFTERIIPQIYQPEEFIEAMRIGYRDILWTLYRYPHKYDTEKILTTIECWKEEFGREPFGIVMPVPVVEKGVAKIVAETGIPIYVHTVNSCAEYRRFLKLGVSSIFTDSLDIDTCYAAAGTGQPNSENEPLSLLRSRPRPSPRLLGLLSTLNFFTDLIPTHMLCVSQGVDTKFLRPPQAVHDSLALDLRGSDENPANR